MNAEQCIRSFYMNVLYKFTFDVWQQHQIAAVLWVRHHQFLPRDTRNAKRGIALVGCPSVCLSVCLSVCNVDVSWAYVLG